MVVSHTGEAQGQLGIWPCLKDSEGGGDEGYVGHH